MQNIIPETRSQMNDNKRPKLMRSVKKLRQRRNNSPDQYQYALQSALAKISDVAGYSWSLRFCTRGFPYARIVILLDCCCNKALACSAGADILMRELDIDLHIVVTSCSEAFWTLCACPSPTTDAK